MPIARGTRLGPYEIQSPLGAGGIGEVYRATDVNLARQVAIKVLPASMSADTERLARFDREAKDAGRSEPPAHPRHLRRRGSFGCGAGFSRPEVSISAVSGRLPGP